MDDVEVNERTLCHTPSIGHHDGRTDTPSVTVPGACGHNTSPALGDAETGSTLAIDRLDARAETKTERGNSPAALRFSRARKSPRTIGSFPLGSSSEMETRVLGSPTAEQRHNAGNPRGETEEEDRGNGKRGESGKRIGTINANDFNTDPGADDGGGSNSNVQRGGPIQNDRGEGACIF